jgi:phytoene dehydrogenase-like protein
LIPLPPLSISFDSWSKNSSSNLWEYAYEVLKKRIKISDNIAPANEWTPIDFAHKQLSYRGTIFGLAADFWQSAFFRPYNRIKKGLYLVGAGTQPGGGVPLVQISASFAINLLNKDFPT